MGFPKDYAKAMDKAFSYQVVWPPNAPVALGDYGTVNKSKKGGRSFERLGSIRDLGVKFSPNDGPVMDVETLQSDGISIGTVTGAGKKSDLAVEFEIGFKKKNSMIYNGSDMYISEIKNLKAVGDALAQLYKERKWKGNWLVVTNLHVTNGLTVLLCDQKGTSVRLGGTADLKAGNLAKASGQAQLVTQSSSVAQYISHGRTTPLLKARKIGRKGFKAEIDDVVTLPRTDVLSLDDDMEFETVNFDYCDFDVEKLASPE